jgi:hypothetical protein
VFKRKNKTLTPVAELNDLLAADPSERSTLVERMSEPVAKALLLYFVNRWHNK